MQIQPILTFVGTCATCKHIVLRTELQTPASKRTVEKESHAKCSQLGAKKPLPHFSSVLVQTWWKDGLG